MAKGSALPSVTTVLGCFVDFSMVRPEVMEKATLRGKKVHGAVAAHLLGLWVPTLSGEVQPYFDSFRRWADIMIDQVLFVEKEIVCDCYGYIGHVDAGLILRRETNSTIIDWKSPITEAKTWKGQNAAYWHLVDHHTEFPKVTRCGSVMLSPKGRTAKMKEHTDSQAQYFNGFLGALQAYKFFK